MDFAPFDVRNYRKLSVREGYRAWAQTYEASVKDELDLRLLSRLQSVAWPEVRRGLDLACGTGRIGAWLRQQGVPTIDGIDFTEEMLSRARERGVYRNLSIGDVRDTRLAPSTYDLVIQVLADEHLSDLRPLYAEAARVAADEASFIIVGYHPHFLLNGIPTHFNGAGGEPLAVESYVHLTSDHVKAAHAAGWILRDMDESIIDEPMVAKKPKWQPLANHPISFLMLWGKKVQVVGHSE